MAGHAAPHEPLAGQWPDDRLRHPSPRALPLRPPLRRLRIVTWQAEQHHVRWIQLGAAILQLVDVIADDASVRRAASRLLAPMAAQMDKVVPQVPPVL